MKKNYKVGDRIFLEYWNNKEVFGPGLDGGSPRKEKISKAIADRRNTQLVQSSRLRKQIKHTHDLAAFTFREINPTDVHLTNPAFPCSPLH